MPPFAALAVINSAAVVWSVVIACVGIFRPSLSRTALLVMVGATVALAAAWAAEGGIRAANCTVFPSNAHWGSLR